MLDILHRAEAALPKLLLDRDGWTGVSAGTKKPRLRRLWRQWGEHRINLHFFEESDDEAEALVHPHPWPFAVRIHEGRYLMDVYAEGVACALARVTLGPGDEYMMDHPRGVHAIWPFERPAKTVMVSGPPLWPRNREKANKVVRGLTSVEVREMLTYFAGKYPYLGDDI